MISVNEKITSIVSCPHCGGEKKFIYNPSNEQTRSRVTNCDFILGKPKGCKRDYYVKIVPTYLIKIFKLEEVVSDNTKKN